jgi:hypothetical protein
MPAVRRRRRRAVTAAITGVVSPAAPPKVPSREAQLKVAQSARDVPPP